MTCPDDRTSFEQRLRALLEESARQASGPVRARLSHARNAAVAEAMRGRARQLAVGRRRVWLPLAAAGSAAVAALVLWPHRLPTVSPLSATPAVASSDLDLLTDRDGLPLVENGDGRFYEWAVYEARVRQSAGRGSGHAD